MSTPQASSGPPQPVSSGVGWFAQLVGPLTDLVVKGFGLLLLVAGIIWASYFYGDLRDRRDFERAEKQAERDDALRSRLITLLESQHENLQTQSLASLNRLEEAVTKVDQRSAEYADVMVRVSRHLDLRGAVTKDQPAALQVAPGGKSKR